MSYGRVSETFWHDGRIRALTDRARHFMLYLMSCPHGNRFGLFVLDPFYAAADVQWSPPDVEEALRALRDAERISWDEVNRVVFVRHYLRHNSLLNQSVVKGALNELGAIPDTPLMKELLEAVREAQIGPHGPVLVHYKELEAAVAIRCRRIMPLIMPGIMPPGRPPEPEPPAPQGESHNAGHNGQHNATQAWEGTGTGVTQTPSTPPPSRSGSEPNLPDPPPTMPDRTDPGERREVVGSIVSDLRTWQPTAAENIVDVHGSREPIRIHGQLVGIGIDVLRYQRICELRADPPEIVAKAIAFLPDVTGLERPLSLALWENDQGGLTDVYQQCVHRVHTSAPPALKGLRDVVKRMPSAAP